MANTMSTQTAIYAGVAAQAAAEREGLVVAVQRPQDQGVVPLMANVMGREIFRTIRGTWVAWYVVGDQETESMCIDVDYLEMSDEQVYVGAWDHKPSAEEVAEARLAVQRARLLPPISEPQRDR